MSTITIPSPARLDPVESATTISPVLRARADEAEALGTLPPDVVEQAERLGLTTMVLPRALGGLEADPSSIMAAIETMSYADGSGGWSLLISNANLLLAWLDPAVARDLLPGRPFSAASMFGPFGRGVPTPGGYRLSGQWPFCSASPHAEMFLNGMLVVDGDRPRVLADGQPDWRFAVFHRADAEILDTWDAIGLRGTGSHDVTTTDTFVPEEHVFMPFDTYARHDGPLWRFSFWGVLTIVMAGLPIGIARHALDALAEMAPVRRRSASPDPIGADPSIQIEVARAEGQLLAARALLTDAVGDAWDTACNGDRPTEAQQARMQLAMLEGMRASTHAVDVAFEAAGASVVYRSSPLGRCFRDIHTAGQHLAFSRDGLRNYGRARLLGPDAV